MSTPTEDLAAELVKRLGPDAVRSLLASAANPRAVILRPQDVPTSDKITIAHAIPTSDLHHAAAASTKQDHRFVPLPIEYVDWAEENFYIADRLDPITLEPTPEVGPLFLVDFQRVIYRFLFDRNRALAKYFQNIIISTVKKSGKTLHAAALGRWIGETWGLYGEILCLGADREQAEDKLYAAITKSIELSPTYDSSIQTNFGLALHPDSTPDEPIYMPDYNAPEWRLRSKDATHIPSHSIIKAVPMDPTGIAGGNQRASLFTEMWTFNRTKARRVFSELTPPPTQARAVRIMEGYAGYEGESDLWEELWDQARNPDLGGRMVTRAELEPYGGWPFPPAPGTFNDNPYPVHRDSPDPIPLYVNDDFRMGAYIDQGTAARRMPWQTPTYYAGQIGDEDYDRHHLNITSAHKQEFVPRAWLDACHIRNHPGYTNRRNPKSPAEAWPPVPEQLRVIPPLDPNEALVLSFDGSVSDDTTVLTVLSYATWWEYLVPNPNPNLPEHELAKIRKKRIDDTKAMLRRVHIWEPTKEHPMNLSRQVKPEILLYYGYILDPNTSEEDDQYITDPSGNSPEYNVLELVYDIYQANDLMLNLRNDFGIWIHSFSQSVGRDKADHDLYAAIRDKELWHDGDPTFVSHILAAARRVPKTAGSSTQNRTHLDKRSNRSKIDCAVTVSQGLFEIRRLNG